MGEISYFAASALLLRLDAPWQIGLAVLVEDVVVDLGVDVFGVDQEAVDIENAGTYWLEGVGDGGHGELRRMPRILS